MSDIPANMCPAIGGFGFKGICMPKVDNVESRSCEPFYFCRCSITTSSLPETHMHRN